MTADPTIWRTMTATASLLGVCDRTIRRRIDSGRYRSQTINGQILVDCGSDGASEVAVVAEARAVSEDARRSSALVAVALERISQADQSIILRLESEVKNARRSHKALSLVASIALVTSVGLGFAIVHLSGQRDMMSDKVSDMKSREADQSARIAILEDRLSDQNQVFAWMMGELE